MKYKQIKKSVFIVMFFLFSACFCSATTQKQEIHTSVFDDPDALYLNEQDFDDVLVNINAIEQEQIKNITLEKKMSLLIMFFRLELENVLIYTKDLLKIVTKHIKEHKEEYAIAIVSSCLIIALSFYIVDR
jgi:hypothetical protein